MRRFRAGEEPAEGESQPHVVAARMWESWSDCVALTDNDILIVLAAKDFKSVIDKLRET